ncbi:uncharacterized protein LOC129592196 [Paramacrobiotus metropolitanus]|uniref:uncharacterized protein LOC129592196 n=1 Tax=Paramacrobiotus metropolitanus TaxID=2943436 RepID=UPI002445AAC8|nr:uncharacterized protein LOC129592196 [Paramacrobiotus metropolitanus]
MRSLYVVLILVVYEQCPLRGVVRAQSHYPSYDTTVAPPGGPTGSDGLNGPGTGTLPLNFLSLPYMDKIDIIWDKILSMKHDWNNLPTNNYSIPQFIDEFADYNRTLVPIFTQLGDENTVPHTKVICPHGTAYKAMMKINDNSTYTGLFGPNQEIHGISRLLTLGYSPPPTYTDNFAPFASFKWPISGNFSQGMVAGYDIIGQMPNRNFFMRHIQNLLVFPASGILPFPRNITVAGFLGAVNQLEPPPLRPETFPLTIAVYEACGIYQNGTVVQQPIKAPYTFRLEPNHQFDIDPNSQQDFRLDLKPIPAGSIIYDLYAQETNTSDYIRIGHIQTMSEQVSSEYADKYFRVHHGVTRWLSS